MENINQNPNFQPISTPEPVKNSNIFKYLFFISIFVLLGVIIGFYFILNNKISKLNPPQINTNSPSIIPTVIETIDVNQILSDLQKDLKVSSPINALYFDWLIPNNQSLSFSGSGFSLATIKTDYVGKYGNYSIESLTENTFKPLQSAVDSFFQSNGFKKNEMNTYRKAVENRDSEIFINSYTKGELKCSIRLETHTDPFFSIACGTEEDKNKTAEKISLAKFIVDSQEDPNLTVSVSKIIGNYATGGAGPVEGSGYGWIAVKVNGIWKIVAEGQDLVTCDIVDQYQIPKEIYGNCNKY